MSIAVIGAVFVDIKGFPSDHYLPTGRNAGRVEYIHGGVARNVVEDIANAELRPTFVSIVDDTPMGAAVVEKLRNHKVNTDYVLTIPDGMGTWLAVFDESGDVAGSISKRPNMMPLLNLLERRGDEIFAAVEGVVLEVDMDKEIVKKVIELAEKHNTKLFALVSNMSIAVKRRDFLQKFTCFICNQQEAGQLFLDDYSSKTPEEMREILQEKVLQAQFPAMVVTMGGQGAVYADCKGVSGMCPARSVQVVDTTGAGDAFCAGVSVGLTYGKTLGEAVEIGTYLAASVITSSENVCPRFRPQELGLDVEVE
ncbi:MAG: bifunctional hydroxymethylpyrimidine kinase/phosphomethylpyrimidine kinase [Oscillospiraceae bacterium]|nr:bifunctional hydroxymethylpyrimidine kinase/phosphomethylpyrimidine kinase [Oscillospiraceae bacterium]